MYIFSFSFDVIDILIDIKEIITKLELIFKKSINVHYNERHKICCFCQSIIFVSCCLKYLETHKYACSSMEDEFDKILCLK